MLQLKRDIQLTGIDWAVAALGLVLILTCPLGSQMWSISIAAGFKWAGCVFLMATLSYQLLHKGGLRLNCLALKVGFVFLALYGVLLVVGVREVRLLHACQALVYCCVTWFIGVWMRSPVLEA